MTKSPELPFMVSPPSFSVFTLGPVEFATPSETHHFRLLLLSSRSPVNFASCIILFFKPTSQLPASRQIRTFQKPFAMSAFYDEVEIEDFEYDEELDVYTYPCPCGDKFSISAVRKGPIPMSMFLPDCNPSNRDLLGASI